MSLKKYNEAFQEMSSIRDAFRLILTMMGESELFYGHGTDNLWDDALALVFDTLQLPYEEQQILLDAKLTNFEKDILAENINKRIHERLPTPYITHKAWFAGLPFYVDERVIVPRSPFAELIEAEFSPWIDIANVTSVLDLCTGSACIAIATACHMPDVVVDAVDISEDALAVAKINLDKYQLNHQVSLIQSDLFNELDGVTYDIIISNPPYVDKHDMDNLPEEFECEPELALASGHDGLDATTVILQQAKNHLNDNGILIVEVGNSQEALMVKYPQAPFMWLDFARGGEGVFLLTKEQLQQYDF